VGILYLLLIFVAMYFVCVELEKALSNTGHRLKLPESIAGATLLAIASSAPEFFTAFLGAVVFDRFDVGLIAIVWSAIFNITVIPGASGLMSEKPLDVNPMVIRRDAVAYGATAMLLLGLIDDGMLTRTDALILLGAYALYVYVLFLMLKSDEPSEGHEQPLWRTLLGLVVGIALIGVLCHFMLQVGGDLATEYSISFLLVSALVFAPGTSVPDMFLSILAAKRGKGSAAISNAFGSNSFDLTLCLAAPILIVGDVQVDVGGAVLQSIYMLLGTVALTMVLVRTNYSLSKKEGVFLIAVFVALAVALVLLPHKL
jgi:cation:H+ antiporter